MSKVRRDISGVRDDIISLYRITHSIEEVSIKLFVAPSIVSRVCHEEGLIPKREERVGNRTDDIEKDSCFFCRSFSRTSLLGGYCMKHRRSVRAKAIEYCFKS